MEDLWIEKIWIKWRKWSNELRKEGGEGSWWSRLKEGYKDRRILMDVRRIVENI